jgi:tRNA threonylcarbamoyladenosine biosynthesis protein TsaE
MTLLSKSEKQTREIASKLAKSAKTPALFCLYGNLGSGKTVFAKGFAEGLGIPAREIKSPTYTFVREYRHGKIHFFHFDFYRIEGTDDLMAGELSEIFALKNAMILVEWPEHVEQMLPKNRTNIYFEYIDETTRNLQIHP